MDSQQQQGAAAGGGGGGGGMMISNPFVGVPKLTKAIAAGLGVVMCLGFIIPKLESLLCLNVGYTIPPYFFIWNIFTSGFYESSIISGIMDIALLLLFGKFLEPIWGSKEFLLFIAVVNAAAGVACFVMMVMLYSVVGSENMLYKSNLSGFAGVIAGFTVAFKQLMPEHELNVFFSFNLRAKHMPGVVILTGIVFLLLGFPSRHLLHVFFGTIAAWVYLRYYQRKGGVVGDLSDSFAFATFWPEPLHPVVRAVTRVLSYPLRLVGIMPTKTTTSSYSSPYSHNLITVSTGPDAERRRALAQRAVDARMATQTKLTNSMIVSTNHNEIAASAEIIPDPTPATLTTANARPAHQGDKT